VWPDPTHGEPDSREVLAGKLAPFRTAAECIDFDRPARSIFNRKRPLVDNTQRRVAKGLWRHVLTSAKPFIVSSADDVAGAHPLLTPFISEHANGSTQRNMAANEPMRTICGAVKGGHFSIVSPTLEPMNTGCGPRAVTAASLAPLRGTTPAQMGGHGIESPLSTVSAGGTHHALVGANLITIGYGERTGQDARAQQAHAPLGTVVATNKHALVAAHLVDMGHGESATTGAKRWSHGVRSIERPLNTVTASGGTSAVSAVHLTHLTHHGDRPGRSPDEPLPTVTGAHRGEQALVSACLEQANGGFYKGDGRPADAPMSTINSRGANQRLITAYCVRYTGDAGAPADVPATGRRPARKGRRATVLMRTLPADCLAEEHRERAKLCADLLHHYLPEHFPAAADFVLVGEWVLVDITLRMLAPRELFRAQAFPETYAIDEIPDPAILFKDGVQRADPLSVPRIPLTTTAQVRMCGNSVSPVQSCALAVANFSHERLIYAREAA
jgi:DNA (cytosine-5)-methyltransferase 1